MNLSYSFSIVFHGPAQIDLFCGQGAPAPRSASTSWLESREMGTGRAREVSALRTKGRRRPPRPRQHGFRVEFFFLKRVKSFVPIELIRELHS